MCSKLHIKIIQDTGDKQVLKSKLFYVMAIAYIAILSTLFGLLYPSVSLGAVSTVLAVVGFALASVSYYLIQRVGPLKKEDQ